MLPSGKGLWSAIWMLPTDWEYGGWPMSGEIDIMEHAGYQSDTIYASVHTEAYHFNIGTNKTDTMQIDNPYDAYHVFSVEWEPESYSVFMDDIKYFTFNNEQNSFREWPFDQRFHLLLNLAVRGTWGGKYGVDEQVFPAEFKIDYVRVYQEI